MFNFRDCPNQCPPHASRHAFKLTVFVLPDSLPPKAREISLLYSLIYKWRKNESTPFPRGSANIINPIRFLLTFPLLHYSHVQINNFIKPLIRTICTTGLVQELKNDFNISVEAFYEKDFGTLSINITIPCLIRSRNDKTHNRNLRLSP